MEARLVNKVVLLVHPKLAMARRLADDVEEMLASRGIAVWRGSAWEAEGARAPASDCDLIIAFGGDGTTLRAARLAIGSDTPIIGVGAGRLGFLAELQPNEVGEKLPCFLAGDFWVEERSVLHAELRRNGLSLGRYDAVNDVVAGRGMISRAVQIKVVIDEEEVTTYTADGLIVATPTGSTAYSLACGGPVLHPELRNILLTPVAPHLSVWRSLVLPETACVEIMLACDHQSSLSIDGQVDVPLANGDSIKIWNSPHLAKFARVQSRSYFYASLAERLSPRQQGKKEPSVSGKRI